LVETFERVDARPLLIVGGHLALDFANTVDDPGGPADFDHLGDVERALAWARHYGVLDQSSPRPADPAAQADLRRLHQLRETVQSGFTAVAHGEPFPDTAWRELRQAVAEAIAHADLVAVPDRVRLSWSDTGLDSVGDAVAQAAYTLLTGGRLARIKRCAECHWLFLDQSKNGSRRWCSMEDCGTSTKMRRYVARRAARRAAADPSASAPLTTPVDCSAPAAG
jgi:predicted RNA-binding Zn ribbon-like protein